MENIFRIDNSIGHKTSLNKFKRIEITVSPLHTNKFHFTRTFIGPIFLSLTTLAKALT